MMKNDILVDVPTSSESEAKLETWECENALHFGVSEEDTVCKEGVGDSTIERRW